MWKQILDFTKSVASTYRRLTQVEEAVKKLQTHSEEHDDEQEQTQEMLRHVLYEIQKDRQLAERDKQIAEKDREILLLRLDAALKNDTRALPSAANVQVLLPNQEGRIASLEKETEELKKRIEALEHSE